MPPVIVLAASFVVAIAASLLHSRILGHEGRLEAGVRAELLARLAQTGPRAVTDVARDLGYDRKTILYHARLLVKAERVRLERCGQNLMIALPKQDLPARRVSATASCARVLETLRAAAAPLDRTAIHAALPEMPRRTRDHALAVLVGEGIVEVAPEGFRLRARAA